ncbi:tripartite tricarboxylate transporter TctB family protein [candidate division KSB1 bacterium]|nr:tripartite tricarboxylate transporter TctB family protein [candidate division KSB1 bacterium]
MKKTPIFFYIVLSIVMIGSMVKSVRADFPEKNITIVVHSKAGSAIDLMARKVSAIANKYIDVPIIVENIPGGSGLAAMRRVADKKADGYTVLGVVKSFISTVLLTDAGVGLEDFHFLTCMVVDPEVLITNRHSDIRTLDEIIADAKEKNGTQKWLGPLVGGLDHLMAVKTWEKIGIRGNWVPFEGGSGAIVALLGQHGKVYVGNPIDVKGRPDLMIAAVAAPNRLKEYPDAPTFTEKGFGLEDEIMWRGFAVKKGTNPDVVKFLENLFQQISNDPDWVNFIETTSAQPVFYNSEVFSRMIADDNVEAVKYLNIAGVLSKGNGSEQNLWVALAGLVAGIALLLILIIKIMKKQPSGVMVFSVILIGISLFFYYLTWSFPQGSLAKSVGPASIPRIWIYTLFVFSLWQLINTLRKPEEQIKKDQQQRIGLVIGFISMMVIYLVIINVVGYFISTLLFLVTGILLLSYRKYIFIIVSSVGFVLFAYLFFYKMLQIPLPMGFLFD